MNGNKGMTILLAGGKTGGHLFPGIAVAEELRARGVPVAFVGTRGGLEEQELPARGFELDIIRAGGLKGKGLFDTLRNLAVLPFALLRSWLIIRRRRAGAVVSLGGFAAGPVALAARLSGRRVFVMEQNTVPGITNRIVGRFADRIFLSFPDIRGVFPPTRAVLTGNPVRREVIEGAPRELGDGRQVLAVFGGSQGAHSLNEMLMHLARAYPGDLGNYFVFHQTGAQDLDAVRRVYAESGIAAEAVPFVRDVGAVYRAAAVIVCRAGATTIAELAALRRPAVYVPFPFAADNHQYHNARFMTERGGGALVEDAGTVEERGERLRAALKELAERREEWSRRMAAELPGERADRRIADEILAPTMAGGA
ncbi:MAG TPA: undecaprenyldiphospho-muramoylpentapeptide beta-N-acetylglucosaminyltransferase [bacterium]|nr:undecaprenyldiphospho-muramoylpentapeptide beta-N-acetylglucosaminyltransferase [bacterium]